MQAVKGMVQVGSMTFRIARVGAGIYEAVRILDDARVGTFQSSPLKVLTHEIEYEVMRKIALSAMHEAKVSWVGHLPLRSAS